MKSDADVSDEYTYATENDALLFKDGTIEVEMESDRGGILSLVLDSDETRKLYKAMESYYF